MFLSLCLLRITYILFIDESYWIFFFKRREIVIELVHHIRPPMRTRDRDNYKKKHPDIWNGKNHSVIVLLVQNEIIRTYWRNILYVTAHTAGDILRLVYQKQIYIKDMLNLKKKKKKKDMLCEHFWARHTISISLRHAYFIQSQTDRLQVLHIKVSIFFVYHKSLFHLMQLCNFSFKKTLTNTKTYFK